MIDTKTLTCSNCHGGDFIRLDDNEFKCTHCGSITIVQDDVAERLEQILSKLQAPAATPPLTATPAIRAKWVLIWVGLFFFVLIAMELQALFRDHSTDSASPYSSHGHADVDPGLLKVENLHRATPNYPDYMVGMVRNDSDRVVSSVSLSMHTFHDNIRGDDQSASMDQRLLPGESQPIVFTSWPQQAGQRFEIASKEVRTEENFGGRAPLRLDHEQLIRKSGESGLRFIGQLTNAQTAAAKSIEVSINLFDRNGRLIGTNHGSPESRELAVGETTDFDISISPYDDADIASMQYLVDSERVKAGADQ
jgi:hypothetical protein